MILNRLSILNYKNIQEADLTFSPHINCFIGMNGEGKTNFLDAIYFLSFTKSATNSVDALNIRHEQECMMLQAEYDLDGTIEKITCGIKRGQKKTIKRGDKAYKRMAEHIGLLPIILISPNDQVLIAGGSDERRKFMDQCISQYNRQYMEDLMRHNKALQQRNTLLKDEDHLVDPEMLSIYEEVMAETGERIFQQRQAFVSQLIPLFQDYYTRISGGHETVSLSYSSHCQRGPLLEVIQRDRQRDIAVGHSLHGIHRDELEMTIDGYPLRIEASQGQSKTFLISLKLAQFHFLRQTGSHTTPLLLLDDIFDKLDSRRVEQIIKLANDEAFGQIFITDTNRENLDRILANTQDDYRLFTVQAGKITS